MRVYAYAVSRLPMCSTVASLGRGAEKGIASNEIGCINSPVIALSPHLMGASGALSAAVPMPPFGTASNPSKNLPRKKAQRQQGLMDARVPRHA